MDFELRLAPSCSNGDILSSHLKCLRLGFLMYEMLNGGLPWYGTPSATWGRLNKSLCTLSDMDFSRSVLSSLLGDSP